MMNYLYMCNILLFCLIFTRVQVSSKNLVLVAICRDSTGIIPTAVIVDWMHNMAHFVGSRDLNISKNPEMIIDWIETQLVKWILLRRSY